MDILCQMPAVLGGTAPTLFRALFRCWRPAHTSVILPYAAYATAIYARLHRELVRRLEEEMREIMLQALDAIFASLGLLAIIGFAYLSSFDTGLDIRTFVVLVILDLLTLSVSIIYLWKAGMISFDVRQFACKHPKWYFFIVIVFPMVLGFIHKSLSSHQLTPGSHS